MKQYVHNELEAIVLIKESILSGDNERFDGARFYTHDGEFLFKSHIRLDNSIDMFRADGSVYNKTLFKD